MKEPCKRRRATTLLTMIRWEITSTRIRPTGRSRRRRTRRMTSWSSGRESRQERLTWHFLSEGTRSLSASDCRYLKHLLYNFLSLLSRFLILGLIIKNKVKMETMGHGSRLLWFVVLSGHSRASTFHFYDQKSTGFQMSFDHFLTWKVLKSSCFCPPMWVFQPHVVKSDLRKTILDFD